MGKEIADYHRPVLLEEVLRSLSPQDGGVYVDCNLGMGGHSEALLEASSPSGRIVGFDWDKDALELAKRRLQRFGDRVQFVHDNFARLAHWLLSQESQGVDGILLDLGLSSFQIDKSKRGFSFQGSEDLDMRMDIRNQETAHSLLNTASQEELADIFYYYGEEKQARRIASFIVKQRKQAEFQKTDELVALVEKAIPKKYWPKKIHVATKVFQGLRIAVNREFENLEIVLKDGEGLLKEGGVFCAISFHSLEDRLIKRAFQKSCDLEIITKKPIVATTEECRSNPRARSAKLRVARKRQNPIEVENNQ